MSSPHQQPATDTALSKAADRDIWSDRLLPQAGADVGRYYPAKMAGACGRP